MNAEPAQSSSAFDVALLVQVRSKTADAHRHAHILHTEVKLPAETVSGFFRIGEPLHGFPHFQDALHQLFAEGFIFRGIVVL